MTIKTSKGTITASKDLLNLITLAMGVAYETIQISDIKALNNEIYQALKNAGYYDEN